MPSLFVTEIFSAIQGEGNFVGERQVFLRLAGCNIRCAYCDQPEALERRRGTCRVETTAGSRRWEKRESPFSADEVAACVARVAAGVPHHSVSVTGGEPLLQAEGLRHVLSRLRDAGLRSHLETNATLPGRLQRVVELVDCISADVKLASVDGQDVDLEVQRRFLEVAGTRECSAKIVLGADTDAGELDGAVAMVASVDPRIEVFLQPVTPFGAVTRAPTPGQVLAWQERALRIHPHVRVVPQTHKAIGQL